jgi:hypothetical protein
MSKTVRTVTRRAWRAVTITLEPAITALQPVALAVRRQVARHTSLRVLAVVAGFGASLLPGWLRWLPVVLLAIPGPCDELAFIVFVLVMVACRPVKRRELLSSLRLAVGARHLTSANECVITFA